MRRLVAIVLFLSLSADAGDRRCRPTRAGERFGDSCAGYAFFEAFPANGAGTNGACSATAPTGAKGEALTFSRASAATCATTAAGGFPSSGIADGELVEMASGQARIQYSAANSGQLALLVDPTAHVNLLPRFIDYANLAWSDVGTPTLTGSQASPFSGTYATSAVTFDDNDAAAFEGRSQPVTVTAAAAYIAHCYVKAGTATTARISLDGTAATITGLSSTTWSIIEVADASSSGVSIVLEIDVGNIASVTGTIKFGGCQVEAGTWRTAIIPTVAASAQRNAENVDFALPFAPPSGVCIAATLEVPTTAVMIAGSGLWLPGLSGGSLGAAFSSPNVWPYAGSTGGNLSVDSTGASTVAAATAVAGATSARYSARFNSAWTLCRETTCASGGASVWSSPTFTRLKLNATPGVTAGQHLWSRIQVDPVSARCQ